MKSRSSGSRMVNNVMETEEARSLDQQQNGSQVSAVVIVEKVEYFGIECKKN